jgi:hypothetical protein
MRMNQRQIALGVLESLREELMYGRLNKGSHVLDVADLRQYIYEQMIRIRTDGLVMNAAYDKQRISRSKGDRNQV